MSWWRTCAGVSRLQLKEFEREGNNVVEKEQSSLLRGDCCSRLFCR